MSNPIVVSFSELDTYRQCPLKHLWAYKERWRRPVDPNGPLAKGTLWHQIMETHYLSLLAGADNPEVWKVIQPYLYDQQSGQQSEVQEIAEWMYEGYVESYVEDPFWEILAVEHPFEVPLLTPTGEESPYRLKGKIDLVVRNIPNDTYWVVDHKSGAYLPNQMDLEIDDQFGLYVWALGQTREWPITGAIHNAARTKMNLADKKGYAGKSKPQPIEARFLRTYLNRSPNELKSIALDAWAVASNAYPSDGNRPLYSSPDPRQCGWKCDFKEVHLLARKGKDPQRALTEYGFEQDFTRH